MRSTRRVAWLLSLLFFFCCLPAAGCEERLSDSELTQLLYQFSLEDEHAGEFLVLPEDYHLPITGLKGVYHLLLVGVDIDGQGVTGRSDSMILAVLNARQKSIKLVSFLRDLYITIPGRGHNRLNAAFAFGGPELLIKTLNTQFQVPVDGYLAVDFSLMARLVDAIGGVDVFVREEELSPLNGILAYFNYLHGVPEEEGLLQQHGEVHLTGHQAMAFSRIRKMDSDFSRVARQQKVLMAIYARIRQLEPRLLMDIITLFSQEVKTDVSLSDAIELVGLVFSLQDLELSTLTIPVAGASKQVVKNKAAFLVPNMKRNLRAIKAFLSPQGGD